MQTFRLFLSMVELRNLTRAAERHSIAPSAVTKRIRDLERHYGVLLFERQSRGVQPTYAGEGLAHHVRDLLDRLNQIRGAMSEFSLGVRGQVRVHANASTLLQALISSIAGFTRQHPLIRIDLQELVSWTIVRNVAEGRADVGVVAGSVAIPSDLVVSPYREDRLMVLVDAEHVLAERTEIAFADVLDFVHVGLGVTSAISVQLADQAARLNRTIRYAYRTATYDVARMLVAEGCGIAILPSSLTLPYARTLGLTCVPLSDPWARREMRVCYREGPSLTASSRLFVGYLLGAANEPSAPAGRAR